MRARATHSMCAWRRLSPCPSGRIRACSLIAVSRAPQNGHRYVAGFVLWYLYPVIGAVRTPYPQWLARMLFRTWI